MTYHDYYLSVPSEVDMPEIPEGASLDVIGLWCSVDENNPEIIIEHEGWHFNVRSQEYIDWPSNVTQHTPSTPWRAWA